MMTILDLVASARAGVAKPARQTAPMAGAMDLIVVSPHLLWSAAPDCG
jgi:hypothetical protein